MSVNKNPPKMGKTANFYEDKEKLHGNIMHISVSNLIHVRKVIPSIWFNTGQRRSIDRFAYGTLYYQTVISYKPLRFSA